MNICRILVFALFVGLSSSSVLAQFIQGPADSLLADTISLDISVQPGATSDILLVEAKLYVTTDGNSVIGASMGFSWDNPKLQMVDATASPLTNAAFDFMMFLYDANDQNVTNLNQNFLFAGARKTTSGVLAQPARQLWATYNFVFTGWAAGESFTIDKSEYDNGTLHMLVDSLSRYWSPFWEGSTTISWGGSGCCFGTRVGNVDYDPADIVDIADLTLLQDHLFISLEPLPCPEEGNVDGDPAGTVDIADLTFLIDHLFINFPPLGACP